MKFKLLVIILLIFTSISCLAKSNNTFKVENGLLNLQYTDIETLDMIKLQGEWEFYWNQLLKPEDFKDSNKNLIPEYVKVPKSWTSYSLNNKKLPNEGFATYRLRIQKKADLEKTIYGLKTSTVFSSYKLWINNKLIQETGTVSSAKTASKPKFKYQDIPFILDPKEGPTDKIEIIIQVSNFSHQRAGIQKPVFFSKFGKLQTESRRMDILNLLIIGIILIIGLNHLIMYLYRKKDISNLYFSILCLVMILRNITTGDRLITYIIPNINWELLVKLDNFSGFGTIPLFSLFLFSLFKSEFPRFIRNLLLILGTIITILVFATPAVIYGKFRMLFELYILLGGLYLTFGVLLISTFKRRPGALGSFTGMFVLYATAINDVLSSMGLIESAYLAPYGLVIFMIIQSVTITSRSAKAINNNETLSKDLKLEKENLEKNIEERTSELQKQHDELIFHQKKEQQQNWVNVGLTEMNDILSNNKNDFSKLSRQILTELVKYVQGQMGALYILNENDEENTFLELVADYGCTNEVRKEKTQIPTNIGLIGAAFSDNQLQILNNIPDNYTKISSGLGKAIPKSVLIVPLSVDEKVYGVMELASFYELKSIEIDFIEKIAVNMANTLNTVQMNDRNIKLISQFQEQTQQMEEKEEELRQNLEEMEYIREQYEELKKKANANA